MNMMRNLPTVLVVLLFVTCSPKLTSTAGGGKHSEDLSVWRSVQDTSRADSLASKKVQVHKKEEVQPLFTVNTRLDSILDSIDRINTSQRLIDGYIIQVYSGMKREEALNTKKQLSVLMPELESEVEYLQPNFRVIAGKYIDRIEAQKDYLTIKRLFPKAIVIPGKIKWGK